MGRPASGALVLLLVAAAVLSGCAGPKAQTLAASDSPSASVAVPGDAPAVGTVTGIVVDDEARPVADAGVAILNLKVEVRTNAVGAFAFTNVPAGPHDLAVARAGFETALRRIDVGDGANLAIQIILTPVSRLVPFPETFQHTVLHHYGQAHLDFVFWNLGQGGGCESCIWTFTADGKSRSLLVEETGQHTTGSNPAVKTSEQVYFFVNDSLVVNDNLPLPVHLVVGAGDIKNETKFTMNSFCDQAWFCSEERREVWITAFHGMDMPAGYSALPK